MADVLILLSVSVCGLEIPTRKQGNGSSSLFELWSTGLPQSSAEAAEPKKKELHGGHNDEWEEERDDDGVERGPGEDEQKGRGGEMRWDRHRGFHRRGFGEA